MLNPLVCAYIGDAVYELYIRNHLINEGITKVNDLQTASLKYVSAKSQRSILESISENLTKEENDLVRWGRNAKGPSKRNVDIITYRLATGFECLIGYLYLNHNKKRLDEIMTLIFGGKNESIW